MPRPAPEAPAVYPVRTEDRHANLHTTSCNGRLYRDYGGNRQCTGCGFTWTSWGWREELSDQRAKKESRHG